MLYLSQLKRTAFWTIFSRCLITGRHLKHSKEQPHVLARTRPYYNIKFTANSAKIYKIVHIFYILTIRFFLKGS